MQEELEKKEMMMKIAKDFFFSRRTEEGRGKSSFCVNRSFPLNDA